MFVVFSFLFFSNSHYAFCCFLFLFFSFSFLIFITFLCILVFFYSYLLFVFFLTFYFFPFFYYFFSIYLLSIIFSISVIIVFISFSFYLFCPSLFLLWWFLCLVAGCPLTMFSLSHFQIDPKVAFPRRAHPKVSWNTCNFPLISIELLSFSALNVFTNKRNFCVLLPLLYLFSTSHIILFIYLVS